MESEVGGNFLRMQSYKVEPDSVQVPRGKGEKTAKKPVKRYQTTTEEG
jgi:hypothetical protein